MPKVTGRLTDFGLDALAEHKPRVIFTHNTPGVAGASLLTTRPVVTVTAYNGFFEAELVASAAIAPAGWYTVTIEWIEPPSRKPYREVFPGRLYVPAEGGILSDLLRVPANPGLVFDGEEPPANPSPGSWWLGDDGIISEFDGTGWTFKQNIRGPAGYMATGAAEDDLAIARFVAAAGAATATRDALERFFQRKGAVWGNVKDYGAKGDDKTDDTDAIAAALADCDVVFAPRGIYRTRGTKVPSRTALIGSWTREYGTIYPDHGARFKPINAAQTAAIISLEGSGSKLEGITVSGAGAALAQHDGIEMGNQGIVTQCTVYGTVVGISGRYRNGNIITQNQIHNCKSSGILNPLDTLITHNTINANGWNGIGMGNGANDNSIGFNKIEWNDGRGISADGAQACNIVSNIIDRNGRSGISVSNTTSGSYGPNIVRRNGRLSEGVPDEDANIRSENNGPVVWLANQTSTGYNDDGTGYRSPAVALRLAGADETVFIANNLRGGVRTPVQIVSGTTTNPVWVANTGYKGPQEYMGAASAGALAPGLALTHVFTSSPISTYSHGRLYRLAINARTANGSKYAAIIDFQIAREGGAPTIAGSNITHISGPAGSVGMDAGTALAVSIDPGTDAGTITLTVTNKAAANLQLRATMNPL